MDNLLTLFSPLIGSLVAPSPKIPSMMGYWDRDLRCRYCNEAYRQWFGVSPERAAGIPMQDLLGEELFCLNEPHIRAGLFGELQVFDRTLTTVTGDVRQTLAKYTPDYGEDGRVQGFIATVVDIGPWVRI
jgi:PAS domain S-box-containing protein